MRPVRVLWSQDIERQTRGYWAIGVALHRAGCEVVLGGAQTPAEVVEAATQEQVDVVGYRAMGEGAAGRVEEVRVGLAALGSPGAPPPPLAAAGIFEPEEIAALRASGVREVFEILTPIEQIAERLRALGAEAFAAKDA